MHDLVWFSASVWCSNMGLIYFSFGGTPGILLRCGGHFNLCFNSHEIFSCDQYKGRNSAAGLGSGVRVDREGDLFADRGERQKVHFALCGLE